jgi:uncharacterized repeat protein (TIGR01451 family)
MMEKTTINKIFVISAAILAIGAVSVPQVFATGQASFSSAGMFEVGNHANAGTYNWTTQLNNMKPGDQVAFNFTFLNNSSVTAIDAKSSFSATSNSNCIQVTGTIWAQNAPSVSRSVSICAATGYTISLSQSSASFGGVGDVAPGYGGIEYYATGLYGITGQGTVQQPTAQLWAEYPNGTTVTQVPRGTAVFMHWTSTNASECHVLAGAGFSTGGVTQGQDQVSALDGTTTFSIQCTNSSGGSVQANSTVTVINNPPPVSQPTANIYVSPSTVNQGQSTSINWSSTNATECHATQGPGFSTGGSTSGSVSSGSIFNSTTFAITCTNSAGSANDSATVYVNNTPPPVSQPTAQLWAEYPNGTTVTQVPRGTAVFMHWTSTNASECHVLAGAGFSTGGVTQGQDQVSALDGTTTFSIQCTNSSGGSVQANSTVTVINNPPPVSQPTANIYVSPSTVNQGQSTTISWSSSNANSCYGTGFSTGNMTSGSVSSGALYNTTTYSVTCTNSAGSAHDSTTVTVGTPPVSQPTATLNVNPSSVNSGGTTQITWSSTNATNCQGNGFSTGNATSGSVSSGAIFNTTTYLVTCTNSSGSAYDSKTVTVGTTGNAPIVQTRSATGISQTSATLNGLVNPNGAQTYYSFEYGTSQSLGNSTSLLSAGVGTTNQNVTSLISGLTANTTYYFRIDAQNTYGSVQGSILSFTTNPGGITGNAPIVQTQSATGVSDTSAVISGTVNPNGDQASYWFEYGTSQSLGNSTTFLSAGNGSSVQSFTASLNFLSQNTTYYYRIVASNSYGTSQGSILNFTTTGGGNNNCSAPYVQTQSATNIYQNSAQLNGSVNPNNCQTSYWFEYGPGWSLGNTSGNQTAGSSNGSINISSYISGLNYNATYYFRAVAQNSAGTSYGSILSFTTTGGNNCIGGNCGNSGAPYVQTFAVTNFNGSMATFNGSVTPNSNGYDTAYGWFEYGTDINSLYLSTYSQYVGSGNYAQNFSQQVYNLSPNTTYYYRAAAKTSYGTAYGQILSTGGNNYNNGSAPQVITNAATNIGNNSALLNGQVDANGAVTSAWFEYGRTTGLGSQSTSLPIGAGTDYLNDSAALSGLSANTTYYFRAAAQNSYGTGYGSILSFTTSGGGSVVVVPQNQIIYRTISTGPTTTNTSCVILVPSLNVSELTPGQNFTLTITYRNGCTSNLSNVFLKVILPTGTDFVSTNYPFFNRDANGISYNLGALPANFQSAISIEGNVVGPVNPGDSVIFSAVINYNDVQGKFQSLSAYLTAVVGSGSGLGANILEAFGNLLGNWIFDLILIIIVAALIYGIFIRKPIAARTEDDVLEAKPMV